MGSSLSRFRGEVPIELLDDSSKVDSATPDSDRPESPPPTPEPNPPDCNLDPLSPPSRGARKNLRNVSAAAANLAFYTFGHFLMSRGWTFTGLEAEDGSAQKSASNFMCLDLIYGRPQYVVFQPIDLRLRHQECCIMVWNLDQGRYTWKFLGVSWSESTIRNPYHSQNPLHDASLTIQAIINHLRLPIGLIDLPIRTDRQNRSLNENLISFLWIGHHSRGWIQSTDFESLESDLATHHG